MILAPTEDMAYLRVTYHSLGSFELPTRILGVWLCITCAFSSTRLVITHFYLEAAPIDPILYTPITPTERYIPLQLGTKSQFLTSFYSLMAASRKYAELILKSASRYPSYDLAKRIRASDAGEIDPEIDIFEGEGIYEKIKLNRGDADSLQDDEWHTQPRTVQSCNLRTEPMFPSALLPHHPDPIQPIRKFSDLLFSQTSYYYNDDPARTFKVGDYGELNAETGIFEKEGNVYDDGIIADYTDEDKPHLGEPLPEWHNTRKTTVQDLVVGPETGIPGREDTALSGTWTCTKKRAALLLMYRPQLAQIPPERLFHRLADIKSIYDKTLVSQVYSCPAYVSYLTDMSSETFTLTLPTGPPKDGADSAWSVAGDVRGICRIVGSASSETKYTPLYHLRCVQKTGPWITHLGVPDEYPEGDDTWMEHAAPWGDLDEYGIDEE